MKTEKSKNPIPLDDDLIEELLAWRRETPYAEDSDYIFASPKMKGKQPYWMSRINEARRKRSESRIGEHPLLFIILRMGDQPTLTKEIAAEIAKAIAAAGRRPRYR